MTAATDFCLIKLEEKIDRGIKIESSNTADRPNFKNVSLKLFNYT